MIITKSGYDIKEVHYEPCNDNSEHLLTVVFKFKSLENKFNYIIRAEFHKEKVFAIKFYPQYLSKSDYRYRLITNRGDLVNILVTTAKVAPFLLKRYPDVSFCFAGARSFDRKSKRVEDYRKNQRFTLYSHFVKQLIGNKTFTHYSFEEVSGYMLINNKEKDVELKKKKIATIMKSCYNDLHNV